MSPYAERCAAFEALLPEDGPLPVLQMPGGPFRGGCWSCGGPEETPGLRCAACVEAATDITALWRDTHPLETAQWLAEARAGMGRSE
jgi:hypothetical protein